VPMVADVTMAAGPDRLRAACAELVATTDARDLVVQWLTGEQQPAAARYLARASVSPVMEALKGDGAEVSPAGLQCPHCTGLPQLSYSIPGPEDLATGKRFLLCSRCQSSWGYPRMTCAGCGEADSHKLLIFSEEGTASGEFGSVVRGLPGESGQERPQPLFPHMRIDGCQTCMRYLLNVDMARDPRAVPFVDEIAALPLDLYAKEQGFSKITTNLMGF
jgi:formate dehydrogenase maturation protein FdhE